MDDINAVYEVDGTDEEAKTNDDITEFVVDEKDEDDSSYEVERDEDDTVFVVVENGEDNPDFTACFECPICLSSPLEEASMLVCGHSFCKGCITQHFEISHNCPFCRTSTSHIFPNIILRQAIDEWETHKGRASTSDDGEATVSEIGKNILNESSVWVNATMISRANHLTSFFSIIVATGLLSIINTENIHDGAKVTLLRLFFIGASSVSAIMISTWVGNKVEFAFATDHLNSEHIKSAINIILIWLLIVVLVYVPTTMASVLFPALCALLAVHG